MRYLWFCLIILLIGCGDGDRGVGISAEITPPPTTIQTSQLPMATLTIVAATFDPAQIPQSTATSISPTTPQPSKNHIESYLVQLTDPIYQIATNDFDFRWSNDSKALIVLEEADAIKITEIGLVNSNFDLLNQMEVHDTPDGFSQIGTALHNDVAVLILEREHLDANDSCDGICKAETTTPWLIKRNENVIELGDFPDVFINETVWNQDERHALVTGADLSGSFSADVDVYWLDVENNTVLPVSFGIDQSPVILALSPSGGMIAYAPLTPLGQGLTPYIYHVAEKNSASIDIPFLTSWVAQFTSENTLIIEAHPSKNAEDADICVLHEVDFTINAVLRTININCTGHNLWRIALSPNGEQLALIAYNSVRQTTNVFVLSLNETQTVD